MLSEMELAMGWKLRKQNLQEVHEIDDTNQEIFMQSEEVFFPHSCKWIADAQIAL